MKKSLIMILLLCSMLALSACQGETAETDIAAIVNGTEITMQAFNDEFDYNLQMITSYGTVVNTEMEKQLRHDVLDTMIRNELLIQEANADDYTVTDEELEDMYQNYVEQYETEEKLIEALQNSEQTVESFKQDLRTQMDMDHFLNAYIIEHELYVQLIVSDEEIQAAFVQYALQSGQEGLKLEDIRDQIKSSLEQEKQITVIREISSTLMEASEIEYIYQTE